MSIERRTCDATDGVSADPCILPFGHVGDHIATSDEMDDRVYLDLKGSLERLSRAQVHLPSHWRSDAQAAINIVKLIGSSVCPDVWSEHDQPEYPEPR